MIKIFYRILEGPIETHPEILGKLCNFTESIMYAEDVVIHHESGYAFMGGDDYRRSFFPPLFHLKGFSLE